MFYRKNIVCVPDSIRGKPLNFYIILCLFSKDINEYLTDKIPDGRKVYNLDFTKWHLLQYALEMPYCFFPVTNISSLGFMAPTETLFLLINYLVRLNFILFSTDIFRKRIKKYSIFEVKITNRLYYRYFFCIC